MNILAAKQVGPVSYLTSSKDRLVRNIEQGRIRTSRSKERNESQKTDMWYVSLSRDLSAAAKRNPDRWYYGVIIDGDKLSNMYHIEPYSFAGNKLNSNKGMIIKSIRQYDDGTCKMTLVNWPTMDIPKQVYDAIKDHMLSMPEDFNKKHKFTIEGPSKVKRGGKYRTEYYYYNVKHGGFQLSDDTVPPHIAEMMLKHTNMNETEERVWFDRPNFLNIQKCMVGIVMPRDEVKLLETSDVPEYKQLRECCEKYIGPNYRIETF